jgi:hypothetical protein
MQNSEVVTLKKAIAWMDSREAGASSKVMIKKILNIPSTKDVEYQPYPVDPSDFGRCYRLVNQHLPELKEKINCLKSVSKKWSILIENWSELEGLYEEERTKKKAPKLYKRLKELLSQVNCNEA